jgi:hypothetical protein
VVIVSVLTVAGFRVVVGRDLFVTAVVVDRLLGVVVLLTAFLGAVLLLKVTVSFLPIGPNEVVTFVLLPSPLVFLRAILLLFSFFS